MSTEPEGPRSQQRRLEQQVERYVARMQRAERERHGLIAQTAYLGTLGLLFVIPVVIGAYLGSWLDGRLSGYAIHWTLSLIFVGVAIGGFNVYLFIRE